MNRLSGEFQTDLPLLDTLEACAEAFHGLGWPIESVEATRVVSGAGPAAENPPTIEVNLTESEGGTTLRITGSDSEAGQLERDALVAVLDKARDAIKDSLESASAASSNPEQSSESGERDEGSEAESTDESEAAERDGAGAETGGAPPGWYPDAYDSTRLQYWDGEQWTREYRPAEVPDAEQTPEPHAEAQPQTGETRFRSLHAIAGIYAAFGWLVAIVGSIGVVVAAAHAGKDNSSSSPGLVLLLGFLGVAFYVLLLFGISAAIRLALAVEDHTRSTVALLQRQIDGD